MRGRPRKHANNAEKQAAYRRRRDASLRAALLKRLPRRVRRAQELKELSIRELKLWVRHTRKFR